MSQFDKKISQTVSRHNMTLPTLWIEQKQARSTLPETLGEICISGKQRQLADNIIEVLQNAKQMVVICSFLFADAHIEDAIVAAANRGVRVYLLLASEVRLAQAPGEQDYSKEMVEKHKGTLKRLGGRVLVRSSSQFHAKVIVSDPFSDEAAGFLLTANMNKMAIEGGEEIGVRLNSDEAFEVAANLRWAMWECAEHEMTDNKTFRDIKPSEQVLHHGNHRQIHATTPRSPMLKHQLIDVIKSANKELVIACFGWQHDHPVIEAIAEQAQAGVKVTILARAGRQKTMPALEKLAAAGAIVLGFKWLHAKVVWSDNQEAMVTTANFEKHGLDTGFELGIHLKDERVGLVERYLRQWINTAKWQLSLNAKLGDVEGRVLSDIDGKFEEIRIVSSDVKDLGEIPAKSLHDMKLSPKFPEQPWHQCPIHELEFEWTVKAPVLANKSKEQFQAQANNNNGSKDKDKANKPVDKPYNPPVFKEPNGRKVIAIDSEQQLAAAISLAQSLAIDTIVARSNGAK